MTKNKPNMTEKEREYYEACIHIFPELIQEEFVRMSADFAFWAEKYAVALRAYLEAKLALDKTKAKVWILSRETLIAKGAKPTESMVEAESDQNPELEAARVTAIDTEVEKTRLHGVLESLRTKKDMLVSLGAHVRVEMENDPVLRERVAATKMEG